MPSSVATEDDSGENSESLKNFLASGQNDTHASTEPLKMTSENNKRRCAYLDYLVHINSASSLTLKSKKESEWRTALSLNINKFRDHLSTLSSIDHSLTGEAEESPEERNWDQENWTSAILNSTPTLKSIGATDSVRAIAVLENSANLLKGNNKQIYTMMKKTTLDINVGMSEMIVKQILIWVFAGLTSLDSLQSLHSEVSSILQIIRRCCRWLRNSSFKKYSLNSELQITEQIIEEIFNQR